jgi:hypothetical protein
MSLSAPLNSILSELEASFTGQYLSDGSLLRSALNFKQRQQFARMTRAWISEGIPFAYQSCPLAFEIVREWVADRFGITPRDVTVIGSVRLGYSASTGNFGRPFRPGDRRDSSDLDLAIISQRVFVECSEAFKAWEADARDGKFQVANDLFRENLRLLPGNIRNGFVDPHKIYRKYGRIQPIIWRLEQLTKLINGSNEFPHTRQASVRIYRDWEAFDSQMMRNIQRLKYVPAARMSEINN